MDRYQERRRQGQRTGQKERASWPLFRVLWPLVGSSKQLRWPKRTCDEWKPVHWQRMRRPEIRTWRSSAAAEMRFCAFVFDRGTVQGRCDEIFFRSDSRRGNWQTSSVSTGHETRLWCRRAVRSSAPAGGQMILMRRMMVLQRTEWGVQLIGLLSEQHLATGRQWRC